MPDSDLPKKALGQHWLNDDASLAAICQAASVQAGDVVLEVGPGQGTLTDELLERGAKVTGLELDQALVKKLKDKYQGQVNIQEGDIRTYDFGALPDGYKIVANIPYYLTSFLLRLLTEPQTHKPQVAALLVQKEVAERVAAGPGDMSVIAVAAQFYYQVELGQVVPAELFTPPPKVDSQILILDKRPKPLFAVDIKQFFRLAKAGFSQKRKTLENSLSAGLRISKPEARQLLENANIAPTTRPQNLKLEDWHKLYRLVS